MGLKKGTKEDVFPFSKADIFIHIALKHVPPWCRSTGGFCLKLTEETKQSLGISTMGCLGHLGEVFQ